jgi:hypothetical protein
LESRRGKLSLITKIGKRVRLRSCMDAAGIDVPLSRLFPHCLFICLSRWLPLSIFICLSRWFPHSIFISPSAACYRILYSLARVPLVPVFYIHLPVFRWFPHSIFNSLNSQSPACSGIVYSSSCPAGSRILFSLSQVPLAPESFIHQHESCLFPHSIFICPSPAGSRILYSSACV